MARSITIVVDIAIVANIAAEATAGIVVGDIIVASTATSCIEAVIDSLDYSS